MIKPFALAVTLLSALAGAAFAQQAGTYSGTAADGSAISFTVGTDPSTGNLQVASANISFSDTCNPGSFTFQSSWGLGASGPDLTGSTGTYATNVAGYFDVMATLQFSGPNLTGTIENVAVNFVPPATGSQPTKSAFCKSKKQKYTATLQPLMIPVAGQRPAAVVYGARVIRN